MTTDSDSECSYVANLADFNVMRVIIIVIRVIILMIRLYNCNMSNYSNKSKYSNNNYYINNNNKSNNNNSNCNTICEKKLTEIGSLLHRMHNVK